MRAEVSVKQKRRRQYTPAERETVLGDVGELGILGAAKKHGVPQSRVSRWPPVPTSLETAPPGNLSTDGRRMDRRSCPNQLLFLIVEAPPRQGASNQPMALAVRPWRR